MIKQDDKYIVNIYLTFVHLKIKNDQNKSK